MQGEEVRAQSLPAGHWGETEMLSQGSVKCDSEVAGTRVGNRAIARLLGIGVTTVRRYLRQSGRRRYLRLQPLMEQLDRLGEGLNDVSAK